MSRRRPRLGPVPPVRHQLLLGALAVLLSTHPAGAVTGIVEANGTAVTDMARCRRRTESLTVPIRFLSNTRWDASLGSALPTGSYAASSTRRLTVLPLLIDAASQSALQTELQARVTNACGTRTTLLGPIRVKSFRGKLTGAGVLRLKLVVNLASGRRKGSFVFNGRGVLGPLPTTTSTSSTTSSTMPETSSTTAPEPTTSTTSSSTSTSSTTLATTTTTIPAHCANQVQDEDETAVDCGGAACGPCINGLACARTRDCLSRFCDGGICANPCAGQAEGATCPDDDNPCTTDLCDGAETCQHVPGNVETVCRPAAGGCDAPELCDGENAACPPDLPLGVGEVCRPIAGGCDEEEICDGTSRECPTDRFTRRGAGCRVPRGECDVQEFCPGDSPLCPPDGFKPQGIVCRPAAGECDAAETCTGDSKTCPDDLYDTSARVCRPAASACEDDSICAGQDADCVPNPPKPQGTPCRPRNGDCDVADVCDGTSHDCPDRKMPPSQPCRPGIDECDATEFCTGTSDECPSDQLAPAGSLCRPGQLPCEADAVCTGTHPICPVNPRKPAGTVCREERGPCDVADTCSGTSSSCPDALEPRGTVCQPKAGECDVEDTCTGQSPACPDVHATGVCRRSTGPCDPAESCSDASVLCPPDAKLAAGAVCRAASGLCEQDAVCDGSTGTCAANAPKPAETVCRPSAGPCDPAETCNGQTKVCPGDALAPDTSVCRPAAGSCDVDEHCSGFGPLCPSRDVKKPAFTVCRPIQLNPVGQPFPCDKEEKCDGVSNDCPADGVQSKFFVCREPHSLFAGGVAGQACDAPEFCDGETKFCGADLKRPFGSTCSVATECRTSGVCKGSCGGTIRGAACTSDADCQLDGSKCLPIGPPGLVACGSVAINEGKPCKDGHGTCVNGTCTAGAAKFGGACDGDDYYLIGDPNRRYCGDDPDHQFDLKCCAGSRIAGEGQAGTCLECCNGAFGEFNGGCPQTLTNSRECCSGSCKDLDEDPNNCGSCGNDCFKRICPSGSCFFECLNGGYIENGACPSGGGFCPVSCGDGVCEYKSVCADGQVCIPRVTAAEAHPIQADCEQYRDCANYPVPAGATCALRTRCTVTIGGECRLTEISPLDIECPLLEAPTTCITPDPPGHCGSCKSDDDCFGDDVCFESCTGGKADGPFLGLSCDLAGICARTRDECR